jgi:hypothetical protein
MKFKKGDKVVILKAEGRPLYEQLIGKVGTIVDAECVRIPGVERTTYRVRIDNMKNDNQVNGLWVFQKENSLRHYEIDTEMFVVSTKFNITEMDDIIKGDNDMIKLYEERKLDEINKKCHKDYEKLKKSDERYVKWKTSVDTLKELFEQDDNMDAFAQVCRLSAVKLSNETNEKLKVIESKYHKARAELCELVEEVKSQLKMCETYEQKQNILKLYEIIDKEGKLNAW